MSNILYIHVYCKCDIIIIVITRIIHHICILCCIYICYNKYHYIAQPTYLSTHLRYSCCIMTVCSALFSSVLFLSLCSLFIDSCAQHSRCKPNVNKNNFCNTLCVCVKRVENVSKVKHYK